MGIFRKFKRKQPKKGLYEIGMIRQLLAQDFKKGMERVINKHKKRDEYYILVHADITPTTGKIRTKFIILNQIPPRLIGTMLFYVDNKLGQLRRIWNLPFDLPRNEGDISYNNGLTETDIINQSAKNMPIIY